MSEVDLVTAIIGITLALITTFCFNLGIVYQKKGLKEAKVKGIEIKTEEGFISLVKTFIKLFKVRSWLIGAILGVGGWFPYIISIGMVGVLVTEPVMATGFIFFVPAAIKILKERVGIIEYIAIGMLTISPILIGFAGISDVDLDLYEFVPSFAIFLAISLSLCFNVWRRYFIRAWGVCYECFSSSFDSNWRRISVVYNIRTTFWHILVHIWRNLRSSMGFFRILDDGSFQPFQSSVLSRGLSKR